MNLPSEKTTQGKVRIVVKGQDSFRTSAAAMFIASGFERNPDNVAVIDTNSNYHKLFAGWGFHQLSQVNHPCTLEKMLQSIEDCETKKVIVLDSLDSFVSTLLAIHSHEGEKDWISILKNFQILVARLMLSSCHVIVSIRIRKEMPEGPEVFGLDELLVSGSIRELSSCEFENLKSKLISLI
ncbi:hypothetical protein [Aquiflexum gelatinilyticum]|uniref:hypothetical protein n=1 Tax=Aquiflexum gelatinilyticum TaxID=2961943 RepID=UPI0021697B6A|nr:hypothetical protein [Aquiflexum gelatinilyticum]MCS4432842.1 hypothetical protein [Aquiflexum gelatinilyticum]